MNATQRIVLFCLMIGALAASAPAADVELVAIFLGNYTEINDVTPMVLNVRNNGATTLNNVEIRIEIAPSIPDYEETLPQILPGHTAIVVAYWIHTLPGRFIITAKVDPDNHIVETNEMNNIKVALIIAINPSQDYDANAALCDLNELPDCGTYGCYARRHFGDQVAGKYDAGCCWDDVNEKYTYIDCYGGDPGCTTDVNAGVCCDTRGILKHPFNNYPLYGCTDGQRCFSPTETADINNDGHIEGCWFGRWRDPDWSSPHCAFFSGDCSEEEFWSNAIPGVQEGACPTSPHWIPGGETIPFGEYNTGTSTECCGDDPDEFFTNVIRVNSVEETASNYVYNPNGIDVSSDGDVYAVSHSGGDLTRCDFNLLACTKVFDIGDVHIWDVAVDRSDEDMVFQVDNNGLRKFDCSGSSCTQVTLVQDSGIGIGVATDQAGNVFEVTDQHHVIKYNPGLQQVVDISLPDYYLNGLTVDDQGNVYIAFAHIGSPSYGGIFKFRNDLSEMLAQYRSGDGQMSYPTDVNVDGRGFFIISDTGYHKVYLVDPSNGYNERIWEYTLGGAWEPSGVAAYSDSIIFISDRTLNGVRKLEIEMELTTKCCNDSHDTLVNGLCVPACPDETPIRSCVPGNAPSYCDTQKTVVNNCTQCGCPGDLVCHGQSGECVTSVQSLKNEYFHETCLAGKKLNFCSYIDSPSALDLSYISFSSTYLNASPCQLVSAANRQLCLEQEALFQVRQDCGNGQCDAGENCFSCNVDCSSHCDSYDDWLYGWEYYEHPRDWTCGWDPGPAPENIYEWYMYPFAGGSAYFDDNPVLKNITPFPVGGYYWITWVYSGGNYPKHLYLDWDDDLKVYVWNNCGTGSFTSSTCVRQTICRDESGQTYWHPTLTPGWNVIQVAVLNDFGRVKAVYVNDLLDTLSQDENIWYMDGQGAYTPGLDGKSREKLQKVRKAAFKGHIGETVPEEGGPQ
ncbi:MAG: CARDB domain-containing protein [Nanoarchaeota archaeon]